MLADQRLGRDLDAARARSSPRAAAAAGRPRAGRSRRSRASVCCTPRISWARAISSRRTWARSRRMWGSSLSFGLRMSPRSPPVHETTSTSMALGDVLRHRRRALARLVVGVRVHRHEPQLSATCTTSLVHRRQWGRPAILSLRADALSGTTRSTRRKVVHAPPPPRARHRQVVGHRHRRRRRRRGPRRLAGAVLPGRAGHLDRHRATSVVDDRSVQVDFDVHRPEGQAVTCVVRALDQAFGTVGTLEVRIPASAGGLGAPAGDGSHHHQGRHGGRPGPAGRAEPEAALPRRNGPPCAAVDTLVLSPSGLDLSTTARSGSGPVLCTRTPVAPCSRPRIDQGVCT